MTDRVFSNKDQSIHIVVNEAGSTAHLLFCQKHFFYNEADILSLITDAGISNGLKQAEEINNFPSPFPAERVFLIAEATARLRGGDELVYLIDESQMLSLREIRC